MRIAPRHRKSANADRIDPSAGTGRRLPIWNRVARLIIGLAVLAAVVVAVIGNTAYRSVEAALAARILQLVVPGVSGSRGDMFFVNAGHGFLGLQVTVECTSLILVAPLLAMAVVLFVVTTVRTWRIGLGALAMVVVVAVVNEIRLALIGYSTETWGLDPGYEVSHTFVGSFIGILGFAAGLSVLLLIGLGRTRLLRRRVSATVSGA